MSKFGLITVGLAIGLILSLGGAYWFVESNYTYQGVVINPPIPAPDFTLTDQNGDPYRLSQAHGKLVLLFFGYTNCPDVCPITMAQFKQVKASLGKQTGQVDFVFVTVDPGRDTQKVIQAYLDNFDPAFIGLTGTQEELDAVYKEYGVYVQRQESQGAAGYDVEHTARIYTIDKEGNWIINYPFGMDTNQITQDVLHLLKQ